MASLDSTSHLLSVFRSSPLFAHLPPPLLAELAQACSSRVLGPGAVLFSEDDPADFMFIVMEGKLSASKRNSAGVAVRLRYLERGDVGGTTSMTVDKGRSASVQSVGDATLLCVDKAIFRALARRYPELSWSLAEFLGSQVNRKTRQVADLLETDPEGFRVAFFDTKPYDRVGFEGLFREAKVHVSWFESRLSGATAPLAQRHDAVCVFVNDELTAATINVLAASGVRLIALRCAGYNNVDVAQAERAGITVVRVPAYSPHAVAEHTVALLLALNRHIHRAFNRVREGNFSLAGLVGVDLHGKTAGLIGTGKIGRCTARILRGFGMHVLCHDKFPDEQFARDSGVTYSSLDEVIATADVLSLHTPLTPETYHLIDLERLEQSKPGVILLNTSRGGLVDAGALITMLKRGHVGAAGLDVYEEEHDYFFEDRSDRVITDDLLARLMTFNNVLITSHQAFLTSEALTNIAQTSLDNICQFALGTRGAQLANRVTVVARAS